AEHARKIDPPAIERDHALLETVHIEKVVGESNEGRRLPPHHLERAARVRLEACRAAQDLEPVYERGEGVAQLVAEHGHELILLPVCLLERAAPLPLGFRVELERTVRIAY